MRKLMVTTTTNSLIMKRKKSRISSMRSTSKLLCLILAFTCMSIVTSAYQQPSEQQAAAEHQQQQPGSPAREPASLLSSSESSSALESSVDDLMAAESAQPADSLPESQVHKAFTTSGQQAMMRSQENQQLASVAPVFVQQHHPQQPVQPQAQQQQQHLQHPQQLFGVQHPQLQQRLAMQQQAIPQAGKAFNPFMAAALAGNYGPAQQQIAAAAAASLQARHQNHPNAHQLVAHQQLHPHQLVAPQQHQQHQAVHQQHQQHQPQQHQVAVAIPAQQPGLGLAVQESSIRQNVVPAPSSFGSSSSMIDSNSIELNESPVIAHQQPQQPVSQQLAVAQSAQHPVIAPVSLQQQQEMAGAWPLQAPDIPKIVNLEVKCEKNLMKVSIEFDKVFNGVIFSKGHYNQGQCVHVGQNSGKQQAYFDISINSCGTQGNTQNGLYGMGGNTGSGTFFENTIVVQYDPNVQEVYDHARKLRCTWHDQYEKAVTFRPFPVDMLDIVRADFAGDNVGCWMQIQVGKGPWASEVAGIVKIGQTMTMVLAIKDEENKFDMLVRNCFAHDGKRGPIELVDKSGCITRPKLMSRFTKIKNFGSSATVLSYAHFQAFKFPDSMEVHFQCTIQICRHQCPEQCSSGAPNSLGSGNGEAYSESTISGTFNIGQGGAAGQSGGANADSIHLRKYGSASGAALTRERRDLSSGSHPNWSNGSHHHYHQRMGAIKPMSQTVGLNRIIQVVSTGDLAFAIQQQQQQQVVNGSSALSELNDSYSSHLTRVDLSNQICMSSFNFVLSLVVLVLVLLCSSLIAITMYIRQRSLAKRSSKLLLPPSSSSSSCSSASSPANTMMRSATKSTTQQQVPSQQQQTLYPHHHHHHHQQQQQQHHHHRNHHHQLINQ